jgi:hypothetical protein
MRKGYLYTVLTVLMFTSVFTVSYLYYVRSSALSAADIEPLKTAGIFGCAAANVGRIAGVSAALSNGPSEVRVRFDDAIPAGRDIPAAVAAYANFTNGSFASEVNTPLSFECAALSSAASAVDFPLSPVNYSWGYGNLSKRVIWFRNLSAVGGPGSVNVTLDFRGERIGDIVWAEAEDFSMTGGEVISDGEASGDAYARGYSLMERTVYVPLHLNYTLWVRTLVENSSLNFTVEVGGVNSTRFDIRDYSAATPYFAWFNDTLVTFNMTPGDKAVKVHPDPSSDTEALDVVVLTTDYRQFDDAAPITPPRDPLTMLNTTGGDLAAGLTLLFSNANYTYSAPDLSGGGASEWGFVFADNDSLKVTLGGVSSPFRGSRSLLLELDDAFNGSSGTVNMTASFPPVEGNAYADSGCTLAQTGRLSRTDRLWLARG